MKTFAAAALLTLCTVTSNAQVNYQPGYYIRNDGTKTICLIKDYGWLSNPTAIVCKSSPDAPGITIGMDSILEFGVGNAKYQRFDVDVETSSNTFSELSDSPTPAFRHEKALLMVLVEGRASLYLYFRKRFSRYFFRLNNASPRPLVYKQYIGEDGVIHANPEYLKILTDSINCSAADAPDPTAVRYETKDLVRYFIAYNKCVRSAFTDYHAKAVKTAFHLSVRVGADLANISLSGNGSPNSFSYGNKVSPRIGVEGEFILPFNRNKWAVILSPEYRYYKSSPSNAYFGLDYKALQVFAGARYYMFFGPQAKLYLSALVSDNINLTSSLAENRTYLNLSTGIGAAFDVGFRFRERFGVELQYQLPRQIVEYTYIVSANLTTTTLVLSYRIF